MSVLIKGMEMPKNCINCVFGWNGWCHRINSRAFIEVDMRRHDCPLIELPPHGRLIDADAFMETFRERKRPTLSDGADGSKERVRYLDFISTLQAIKEAPTIIKAERI